jgi:hypothetical protein
VPCQTLSVCARSRILRYQLKRRPFVRRKGGASMTWDREDSIVAYASATRLICRARGLIYSIRGKTSN